MVINKSEGHICFGVSKCYLYEFIYHDNLGYDIIHIHEILWPNTDKLSDEEMITISKILNGEE